MAKGALKADLMSGLTDFRFWRIRQPARVEKVKMSLRKGFTLIELLVVIAIIGILAGLLMPVLGRARELGRRAKCSSNLHAVGRAMHLYASANDSGFPNAEPNGLYANCIGTYVTLDKSTGADSGNSRSLFLLVKGSYLSAEAFICPSTDHKVSEHMNKETDYDFRRYFNLSYSYQVQKNNSDDGYYNPTYSISPSNLPILADRNPISGGTAWIGVYHEGHYVSPSAAQISTQAGKNSFNHNQENQNVLFVSGTVIWPKDENPKIGIDGDNIWLWEDPDTGDDETGDQPEHAFRHCSPTSQRDSFLWP